MMTNISELEYKSNNNKSDSNIDKSERPELVFWFDAPPRAGAGVFKIVSQEWGNKVFYMCTNNLREERRKGGWKDSDHGNAVITILSELDDINEYLENFIKENPNAIHVFNGFRSSTTKFLKKYIMPLKNSKIVVWSERPGVYGKRIKKTIKCIMLPILHRYYSRKYKNKVNVLMPLGMQGIDVFASYGWDEDKMYPFMYNPQLESDVSKSKPKNFDGPIKMLYVGRFARACKGIDVLMKAINDIENEGWELDLVGGYGEYKDETINWTIEHSNVKFLGTWPSNEISNRISEYDLVIVPSRHDGWNVVVNESLHAGVGVISTDNIASQELIEASGAGIVVPADDWKSLKNAIQYVVDNPSVTNDWKIKAKQYSPKINSRNVADYFIKIMDYNFIKGDTPRSECPWL